MSIKKRTFIRLLTFLIAAVLVGGIGVWTQCDRADKMVQANQTDNRAAFEDLTVALQNLNYALQKAEYASTPYSRVVLTADIQREAGAAKTALEQLPVSELGLQNISKLFAQVSDYCFALAKKAVDGQEITDEEKQTLSAFRARALQLADSIQKMGLTYDDAVSEAEWLDGVFLPEEDEVSVLKEADDAVLNEVFLTYDGALSDDMFKADGSLLSVLETVSEEEAVKKAQEYLDCEGCACVCKVTADNLSCYVVQTDEEGVYITERGGLTAVYWNEEEPDGQATSAEEALMTARNWLEETGYDGFETTAHRISDGGVRFSFVPVRDGVYYYGEVVTVCVQNGEVVSFNALNYLNNSRLDRTLSFTTEELSAAEKLGQTEYASVRRVVLPGNGRTETCCYEFTVESEDGKVLLYINAENGREEKISLLIEDENGIRIS